MKYRDQILALLADEDEEAIFRWLEEKDPLDQADIMRELKLIAEETAKENGEDIQNLTSGFEEVIDEFEEAVLTEKLAEAEYVMALEEQEKAMQELEDNAKGIRANVIECIVNQAPNAAEMQQLAQQLIALEKEHGKYEAGNWEGIL